MVRPPSQNRFLIAKDPYQSVVSDTSLNLESLNQRNAQRLQRLEKVDPLDGSVFRLDDSLRKPAAKSYEQDSVDPYSRIRNYGSAAQQDIMPGPSWQHRATEQKNDLAELDFMLADILRR